MRNNYRKILFVTLILLVSSISIGYAFLSANLSINGTGRIADVRWDVHFENPNATANSNITPTTAPSAPASSKLQTISYDVSFSNPGEIYEYTIDIKNGGVLDAMIESFTSTYKIDDGAETSIQSLPSYLDYYITYSDDQALVANEALPHGAKDTILVHIGLKSNATNEQVQEISGKSIQLKLTVDFDQTNGTEVAVTHAVCKRAKTLHTAECTWDDWTESSSCHLQGYVPNNLGTTITYGQLGTSGSNPVSGDAFDCDVNNDGIYNPSTERFYYVSNYYDTSTKTFDNTKATLIYYSNVTNGSASTNNYAYNSVATNLNGPATGYTNLPSTSQWSNTGLLSPGTRQILNETGGNTTSLGTINTFTYTSKAARFLTTQELESACNISVRDLTDGELDTCSYLMENTIYQHYDNNTYGFWLETPMPDEVEDPDTHNISNSLIWFTAGTNRIIAYGDAYEDGFVGVRPVIDIPISRLSK